MLHAAHATGCLPLMSSQLPKTLILQLHMENAKPTKSWTVFINITSVNIIGGCKKADCSWLPVNADT